jgi:hypothetical protein
VGRRDGGQCAFVSGDGHRCTERTFLEFHHILPYAKGGPATVENISLRCRRHNQYEAELVFGPHGTPVVREAHESQWPDAPHPAGAGRYLPAMATSSTSNRSGVFGGIVGGDPALP